MGNGFEYEDALNSIMEEITNLPGAIEAKEKDTLHKIGNVIKVNVEKNLSMSGVEEVAKKILPKNFNGSTPYVHMKVNVRKSVRRDKTGTYTLYVNGGKYTGYKWHLLDTGTATEGGRERTKATHFISKSLEDSKGQTREIVDNMLEEVAKGK